MITVHFNTEHLGQTQIDCDSIEVIELIPARGRKQQAVNVLYLHYGHDVLEVNIKQVKRITWSQ